MNNTSNSNSKAKLICIIAGLLVVILAIALAFTFISKPQQNKDNKATEITEVDTKQNEQQTVTKDIKTTVKDSTYKEAIHEEADQNNEAEQAGDMNGDTSEGVEITDEMKEYTESPESQIDESDNTAEEPKQEEVYTPAPEVKVDDTPEPAPAPEDSSNSNSGSDDNFWGSDDSFTDSWNNIDSKENGWGDTKGWTWQGDVFSDTPEGQTYGDPGWKANGTWHY